MDVLFALLRVPAFALTYTFNYVSCFVAGSIFSHCVAQTWAVPLNNDDLCCSVNASELFSSSTSALLSYTDTTAFPAVDNGCFLGWIAGGSAIVQCYLCDMRASPFRRYHSLQFKYAFWSPTTSSATSSCAFCAGHYLGVALNVLRWGLGRVRSLPNVCWTKFIRLLYLDLLVP